MAAFRPAIVTTSEDRLRLVNSAEPSLKVVSLPRRPDREAQLAAARRLEEVQPQAEAAHQGARQQVGVPRLVEGPQAFPQREEVQPQADRPLAEVVLREAPRQVAAAHQEVRQQVEVARPAGQPQAFPRRVAVVLREVQPRAEAVLQVARQLRAVPRPVVGLLAVVAPM